MDGFSYSNIFETKGIEYIAILAFFAILIPFWIILNKKARNKRRVQELLGTISSANLRIPQGLYFSRNHTWTHLEKSGSARIGLDDLITRITGAVKLISKVEPGTVIRKGDLLAEVDHQGKHLLIYSPVSGVVQELNANLEEQPELLKEDPFRHGWICAVKPGDWKRETRNYYLAEEASIWMNHELVRFKDFLTSSMGRNEVQNAGILMQDGGELREQTLSELPPELWNAFQKDFMNTTD